VTNYSELVSSTNTSIPTAFLVYIYLKKNGLRLNSYFLLIATAVTRKNNNNKKKKKNSKLNLKDKLKANESSG